jgi:hypothetical protein
MPVVSTSPHSATTGDWARTCAVFLFVLVVYNANGREIGTYDSRPSELAARELLLRGTLSLNHAVGATPEYANRWGFILANDARYRAIYSPVPSVVAAAVTWPFWRTGIFDVRAPLAVQLIGKATASMLVALAAAISYRTARRVLPRGRALLLAVGLALGTGWWSSASQTLWQSESAILGLTLAVAAFVRLDEDRGVRNSLLLGAGLALAGTSRPQLAPAIAILLLGVWIRAPRRFAAVTTSCVALASVAIAAVNYRWFGHPLGALPLIADLNADVHATGATFGLRAEGPIGLLVSPSRGLFVFSPIALIAAWGIRDAIREGWRAAGIWCLCGAVAQFILYSAYSVWWGGHTYGPRYLLDILPLLVPAAAAALQRSRSLVWRGAMTIALCWSVVVAATGAFCYPHDQWNSDPVDIDRDHARLWSVSDAQILRCWKAGLSPQNFGLFDRAALRQSPRE